MPEGCAFYPNSPPRQRKTSLPQPCDAAKLLSDPPVLGRA